MVMDDPTTYLSHPGDGRAQFATDDRNETTSQQYENILRAKKNRSKLENRTQKTNYFRGVEGTKDDLC